MVIKIVRGAYMNEENELAHKNNIESPIWPTLQDTHDSYNGIANNVINNLGKNDMFFLASHNEYTVNMVKKRCDENPELKQRIKFG